MVADHNRLLSGCGRKRGQPAALLIHAHIRFDHVLLLCRIQQYCNGCNEHTYPESVIDVEVMSLRGANGMSYPLKYLPSSVMSVMRPNDR